MLRCYDRSLGRNGVELMKDIHKAITDMAPGLQMALYMLCFMGGMALVYAALRWDGRMPGQDGCYEIQAVHGLGYMVNTCDGTHELLKKE